MIAGDLFKPKCSEPESSRQFAGIQFKHLYPLESSYLGNAFYEFNQMILVEGLAPARTGPFRPSCRKMESAVEALVGMGFPKGQAAAACQVLSLF